MSAEAPVYGLTRSQLECLWVVQELSAVRNPSLAEIAHELSMSNAGGVAQLLDQLRQRGYINNRLPGRSRNIRVLRTVPLPADFEFEAVAP